MNLVVAGRLSGGSRRWRRTPAAWRTACRSSLSAAAATKSSALAHQIEDAAYLLRKREREVKDNERRYRDLFDRAPIAFEETDSDGVIRRFNQAVCNLLKSHAGPDPGPQGVGLRGARPAGELPRRR